MKPHRKSLCQRGAADSQSRTLCPLLSAWPGPLERKAQTCLLWKQIPACLYCCCLGSPCLWGLSMRRKGKAVNWGSRWPLGFHLPCIFTLSWRKASMEVAWNGRHCHHRSGTLDLQATCPHKSACSPRPEARKSQLLGDTNSRDRGELWRVMTM